MSSPSPATNPTPSSTSKPYGGPCCLLGCAFGCVFPLLASLVGLVLFFWLGDPILAGLRSKPAYGDPPRITREERWGLADKALALVQEATKPTQKLILSPGEANALLQRWSPTPARGFALTRAWLIPDPDKPIVILSGSGFWMRSLTFAVELTCLAPGNYSVRRIFINAAELSEEWHLGWGKSYLDTYLRQTTGLSSQDLNGSRFKITIASDSITLEGPLKEFPPLEMGASQTTTAGQ